MGAYPDYKFDEEVCLSYRVEVVQSNKMWHSAANELQLDGNSS